VRSNRLLKAADLAVFGIVSGLLWLCETVLRALSRRWRTRDVGQVQVRSILVIKLCCMGDGVLAVPAIRALKRHFPQARLVLLCTPRNDGVFEGLPFVDQLVRLEVTGLHGPRELFWTGPAALLRVLRALRGARPDVAVDLDLYYRLTPVLAFLAGAPIRAGFDIPGQHRGLLLTHRVARPRSRHELECFLDIVAALGAPPAGKELEIAVPQEHEERARRLWVDLGLNEKERVVALFPGSSKNWPVKQWRAEGFAEVGDRLAAEQGLRPLILGAPFEKDLAQQVAGAMRSAPVVAAGRTDVKTLAALLKRCALLVTNDTGPMHLGAAVGVPVVAIFGMTNDQKWRPWGDQHELVVGNCQKRPCYYLSNMPRCDHLECIRAIPADEVYAAALRALSRERHAQAGRC